MERKKACIKTPYGEYNLGNKLQNYAVIYNINKKGVDATTLQYYAKANGILGKVKRYAKSMIKLLLSVIPLVSRWNTREIINEKKRVKIFKEFSQKYLHVSKSMNKYNLDQKYIDFFDYIFIGSDQVWNEEFLDIEDLGYYLGLYDKSKVIALSGSFGISEISKTYKEIYVDGFNAMDAISVREEDGAGIVQKLTGRKPVVLVDPVMTLSKEEWLEISEPPLWDISEAYVLCYFLGEKTNHIEKIEKFARDNNLTMIDIMDKASKYFLIGPAEFIYLVNNADLICTDSFHGSVFSLILNKPFLVFEREGKRSNMSSRISTLLETFNCNYAISDKIEKKNFDWDHINTRIEDKKCEFVSFLDSSI